MTPVRVRRVVGASVFVGTDLQIGISEVNMILDQAIEFLQSVPPFQFLEEGVLRRLVSTAVLEFYPKGTTVLHQEGPASDSLYVIQKGSVKVFVTGGEGQEVVIDYRGEGDAFGFLSLVSGDKSRASVVAMEDTTCYLLSREAITSLLDVNPAFTEYFVKSFLSKYIDKTFSEMHGKTSLYGAGDRLLFTTRVGELATKEVHRGSPEMSIREAAETMSQHQVSSLIIVDGSGVPLGIVTDRDLREKVVARDRSVEDPVSGIMSVSLIKVDGRDYCFEALLRMIRYNIHHLLVVEEGRLKGVVTNHDLMLLQGTSPTSLAQEIEGQQSVDTLVPAANKINKMIAILLKEGARASNITRIISEINDRLVRKVLEIAERKCGRPPVPYCWIVYGSEGRKEQTFKTDQDNALIYRDPATPEEAAAATEYFERLTDFVRDGLGQIGFPDCPANYMASNPRWHQPLRTWKRYFSSWVDEPTPEALVHCVALFDFRPLHGDLSLGEALRDHLTSLLQDNKVFTGFIANMALRNRPPIGFLGSFVVEKDGVHKDQLNLKVKGLAPLVDIARLFALEGGVRETSTLERLEALKGNNTIVREYADEFAHAFEFIMLLRIHNQFAQIGRRSTPDNFIDPNRLSTLEKRSMKDAFALIGNIQDLISERYKSLIF